MLSRGLQLARAAAELFRRHSFTNTAPRPAQAPRLPATMWAQAPVPQAALQPGRRAQPDRVWAKWEGLRRLEQRGPDNSPWWVLFLLISDH